MSGHVDSYCLVNQPIRLSKQTIEKLNDDDVTSLLLVNEYWKKRCAS